MEFVDMSDAEYLNSVEDQSRYMFEKELAELRDVDFVERVHGMLRRNEVAEFETFQFIVSELSRRARE